MGQITGGERQKPRVALLGLFKSNELESLKYVLCILENLDKKRDIDLLIIGENITDLNYSWKENVILFVSHNTWNHYQVLLKQLNYI